MLLKIPGEYTEVRKSKASLFWSPTDIVLCSVVCYWYEVTWKRAGLGAIKQETAKCTQTTHNLHLLPGKMQSLDFTAQEQCTASLLVTVIIPSPWVGGSRSTAGAAGLLLPAPGLHLPAPAALCLHTHPSCEHTHRRGRTRGCSGEGCSLRGAAAFIAVCKAPWDPRRERPYWVKSIIIVIMAMIIIASIFQQSSVLFSSVLQRQRPGEVCKH